MASANHNRTLTDTQLALVDIVRTFVSEINSNRID